MKCSRCDVEMEDGAMYVRGMFTSLLWSSRKDASFLSKRGLDIINLGNISRTPTGAQAVIESARCRQCGAITFDSRERVPV